MDNEVPKQLNLSSNGITNESGIGEPYSLFGFSGSLVSRRTPSTWFLFLEYSRYPHPGGLWTPLSQSLIHSYFLGPQTSLRFYLRSCTYAMLYCFIYDCARSTLYCLGKRNVFALSTSPATLSGSQSFTAVPTTLSPSRSRPASLRVYFKGWPPEIFLNPVIALSWKPRWVLIWFFRGWSSVCCYLCTPAG